MSQAMMSLPPVHSKCLVPISNLMSKELSSIPTWAKENRKPAFIGGGENIPFTTFGQLKFLWGNVPAYDILDLERNEGATFDQDINLCFAASGDLRNLIHTMKTIPSSYTRMSTAVLNDKEDLVTARNVILLLMSVMVVSEDLPEMMLHLWYSARIPAKLANILREDITPLVATVVQKIQSRDETTVQAKTWLKGTVSLRVCLLKHQWEFILKTLTTELTLVGSESNRKAVVLHDTRIDYRERHDLNLSPPLRSCAHKLRVTGVLLPFGSCDQRFNMPNPTLFDANTGEWLQKDSAAALDGYHLRSIIDFGQKEVPKSDINGCLYLYSISALCQFLSRIRKTPMRFIILGTNALLLAAQLVGHDTIKEGFDRIEVANIADSNYVGLQPVLSTLGPLLKRPVDNPQATLITLFMNATHLAEWDLGDTYKLSTLEKTLSRVKRFLPYKPSSNEYDPGVIRFKSAEGMFKDRDMLFNHWMKATNVEKIVAQTIMKMRNGNKVTKKWLYKAPGLKRSLTSCFTRALMVM
ncbi:uncharacterized protein KY384_000490 [Bacidia gigantensis]|uniref:uncharacterized protein n=1 Tax=Bacidia gigantensis TaxID=2732470 RepID=UPI001D0466A9|nr:uncharacterized protein KY384_000490 [Bacidia gigantensis]KAG8525730.1 hypothetical protein KY384_000490 [Bacidia gigantensis]